jgi:hypothetical protein
MHFLRKREGEMHIRSKAYGHFLSICRSLRDLISPRDQGVPTKTSPSLVFAAAVLALLLTILEIDLHRTDLLLVGLMHDTDALNPVFMSP